MTPRTLPLPYDGTGRVPLLHWPKAPKLPAGVTPTWCRLDVADWELAGTFAAITCGRCQFLAAQHRQADPENGVMAQ